MKVTAIIAEYNPFHNGHAYHLQQARLQTNADYILVVLSGDFVQRGTPALLNKYIRTNMALQSGADLVLELPCISACGSAEFFAYGAVSLLEQLHSVDFLCFGSETPDLAKLQTAAQGMLQESIEFKELLQQQLKKGFSYPKARSLAFLSTLSEQEQPLFETLLQSPNNILSIEYLKALLHFQSSIIPYPIRRIQNEYHDTELTNTGFSSATAIRSVIKTTHSAAELFSQMPPSAYEILLHALQKTGVLFEDDFSAMLQYALWNEKDYTPFADFTEELNNRIHKFIVPSMIFSEIAEALKTKQYTRTRINRALLHLLLQIQREDLTLWTNLNFSAYGRILGFRKKATPLLKELRINSTLPLIQQPAKAEKILSKEAFKFFQMDQKAHRLYETVFSLKYHIPYEEELSRKPLIL